MQHLVRSPEALVLALDSYVDNKRFKSRNQLINIILADWLARTSRPIDEYASVRELEQYSEAESWARPYWEQYKRNLLGEQYDQAAEQGVDTLDGKWEDQRRWEELELRTQEEERQAKLEAEITARVTAQVTASVTEKMKADLLATLREELGAIAKGTEGEK
ncbi:MAG: hypothetical protein M0R80_24370 [Proteobacteria bacterium]|nr:hypothetical protein [Pseudomonadota bacterium]